MTSITILVADDERGMRSGLSQVLRDYGYRTLEACDGREAIELCCSEKPAAVLLDLVMPGMEGIAVLHELRDRSPDTPVIIISGHADVQSAVGAMKAGAYDFVVKPPDFELLFAMVKRAVEQGELRKEVERLEAAAETSLEWQLGRSERIRKTIKQIRQVARTDFTIVLEGETGVGKSFIAGLIHGMSGRANQPFIRVDMAAIPETLVESELFGHEKGAYTGALSGRKGFFEQAHGGSLFIDELENMTPMVQTKFLSVLEERVIRHLGGDSRIPVDIRVITATNRDTKAALKEGKFRKDLYYRLSEFVITVPPLRERTEDLPFLAQKFIAEACADLRRPSMSLPEETAVFLLQYPWPGNVRELRNVVRRAVLTAEGPELTPEHLEYLITDQTDSVVGEPPDELLPLKEISAVAVRDVERKAVLRALQRARGNKTRAAAMLQVDFKTLQAKIRDYNITFP